MSESEPGIEPLAVLPWADAQRKCISAALLSEGSEGRCGVALAHAAQKLSVVLTARRLRPPLTAGAAAAAAAAGNGKKGQVTITATADAEDGVFYFENVSLAAAGLWEFSISPASRPNANPLQRRWERFFVAGATVRCEVLERACRRGRPGSRSDWCLLTRHPLLLPWHGGYAQAVGNLPESCGQIERVLLAGEVSRAKAKAKPRAQAKGAAARANPAVVAAAASLPAARDDTAAAASASAPTCTSPAVDADVDDAGRSRKRRRDAARGGTAALCARRRPRKGARPRRIHPQVLATPSSATGRRASSAGDGAAKQQARRKRHKPFAFEDLNGAGDTYTIFSKHALYQQLYAYAGGIRKKM